MTEAIPIIIGGGSLAGLACAMRLKQWGHEACVLDKAAFPRAKLCGEFLGPDALAVLQQLQLLDLIQHHAFGPVEQTYFFNRNGQSVRIQHAWISKQYPYGLAIPRETLDHLLLQHARHLGLCVLEGRRILSPIHWINSKFEFQAQSKSSSGNLTTEHFKTPLFIDATGRSGKLSVSSTSLETNGKQQWVGIQCHVRVPRNTLGKALHMFLFPGGYGGIQPIADYQANLCMMVISPLAKYMQAEFEDFIGATIGQNPAAREILQHAYKDGAFATTADIHLVQPRLIPRLIRCESNGINIIRIGDACLSVDPFTGSGMAHALQTGLLAADIVHNAIQSNLDYPTLYQRYQQVYQRQYGLRFMLMHRFRPLLESHRIQRLVWPILPPFLPMLAATFR